MLGDRLVYETLTTLCSSVAAICQEDRLNIPFLAIYEICHSSGEAEGGDDNYSMTTGSDSTSAEKAHLFLDCELSISACL